jgi:hypothetical protein
MGFIVSLRANGNGIEVELIEIDNTHYGNQK